MSEFKTFFDIGLFDIGIKKIISVDIFKKMAIVDLKRINNALLRLIHIIKFF